MATDPDTGYRPCTPRVAHQTIDGEVVIVDLVRGDYYSLRDGAAEVWSLLEAGATAAEAVRDLESRYDAPPSRIADEVVRLIAQLESHGLIRPEVAQSRPEPMPRPEAPGAKPPFAPLVLDQFTDMRDLILLDPIHEVDEGGWPNPRGEAA
jgi:hypothetical protein